MKGDREHCLASEMDGYRSKPIRPQELDRVLEKYLTLRIKSPNSSETLAVPQ
jgi:two-component system, sensor histidine kinase and response regulator